MNEKTVTISGKVSYDKDGNKLGVAIRYKSTNGNLVIEQIETLTQSTSLEDLQLALDVVKGELTNGY